MSQPRSVVQNWRRTVRLGLDCKKNDEETRDVPPSRDGSVRPSTVISQRKTVERAMKKSHLATLDVMRTNRERMLESQARTRSRVEQRIADAKRESTSRTPTSIADAASPVSWDGRCQVRHSPRQSATTFKLTPRHLKDSLQDALERAEKGLPPRSKSEMTKLRKSRGAALILERETRRKDRGNEQDASSPSFSPPSAAEMRLTTNQDIEAVGAVLHSKAAKKASRRGLPPVHGFISLSENISSIVESAKGAHEPAVTHSGESWKGDSSSSPQRLDMSTSPRERRLQRRSELSNIAGFEELQTMKQQRSMTPSPGVGKREPRPLCGETMTYWDRVNFYNKYVESLKAERSANSNALLKKVTSSV